MQRLSQDCSRRTSHNANAEVQASHRVAEGGCNQTDARQAAPHDHDGPAPILVHQNTADWTWRENKNEKVRLQQMLDIPARMMSSMARRGVKLNIIIR